MALEQCEVSRRTRSHRASVDSSSRKASKPPKSRLTKLRHLGIPYLLIPLCGGTWTSPSPGTFHVPGVGDLQVPSQPASHSFFAIPLLRGGTWTSPSPGTFRVPGVGDLQVPSQPASHSFFAIPLCGGTWTSPSPGTFHVPGVGDLQVPSQPARIPSSQ